MNAKKIIRELCTIVLLPYSGVKSGGVKSALKRSFISIKPIIPCAFSLLVNKIPACVKCSMTNPAGVEKTVDRGDTINRCTLSTAALLET